MIKVGSHCRSNQLDQARSNGRGMVELARQVWSTLLSIAPASYSKISDMSQNSSRDRETMRSSNHRETTELIGKSFFTLVLRSCLVGKKNYRSVPDQLGNQDQDQDSLLVKRRNDNHSPGPVIRELVPSSHQRSELSNTILCIFSG